MRDVRKQSLDLQIRVLAERMSPSLRVRRRLASSFYIAKELNKILIYFNTFKLYYQTSNFYQYAENAEDNHWIASFISCQMKETTRKQDTFSKFIPDKLSDGH